MFGGVEQCKRGWDAASKVVVLSILKCNGETQVYPVKARAADGVASALCMSTRPGSLLYTDS